MGANDFTHPTSNPSQWFNSSATPPGEHHRRAVRQAAGEVTGPASRDGEVYPLPGPCQVLQQAGGEGVVGQPSAVPPGVLAGLLAQSEPDRAAVEVFAEDGAEPVAQDVRGDAGGGGRGVGSPGALPL